MNTLLYGRVPFLSRGVPFDCGFRESSFNMTMGGGGGGVEILKLEV